MHLCTIDAALHSQLHFHPNSLKKNAGPEYRNGQIAIQTQLFFTKMQVKMTITSQYYLSLWQITK